MKNINKYVEHTLLKQDATKEALDKLLEEAKKYNFLGVCIMPPNIKYAKEYLKDTDVKIVTVVGFPLGTSYTEIKVAEMILAINDGADEVDMVLNVSDLKNKNYNKVGADILAVVNNAPNTPVKVIIETDLLTKDEIRIATEIACKAGAKFVKTSTGFVKNGVGAKPEDVKIMAEIARKYNVAVKASGGIKTYDDAVKLIEAGATRLGTSSGVAIIKGANLEI